MGEFEHDPAQVQWTAQATTARTRWRYATAGAGGLQPGGLPSGGGGVDRVGSVIVDESDVRPVVRCPRPGAGCSACPSSVALMPTAAPPAGSSAGCGPEHAAFAGAAAPEGWPAAVPAAPSMSGVRCGWPRLRLPDRSLARWSSWQSDPPSPAPDRQPRRAIGLACEGAHGCFFLPATCARPAGVRAFWLVIVNSAIRCRPRGVCGHRNEYPASMWR